MENRSNNVLVGSIVLILLAVTVAFLIWIAGFGGTGEQRYDILFKTSVEGLAKGSAVTFSGVPVGKVEDIAIMPDQPELIKVQIAIKQGTPVLQGTTATIAGVGFTGVSQINLDGAVQGAPPIDQPGPYGYPLIPPKAGGLGAVLANAPQLLDRLSVLTERVSDLLNPENQKSIQGILAHVDTISGGLADRSQDIADTIAQSKRAIRQAGDAAEKIGNLADSTDANMKPILANLNDAVSSAKRSMANLDSVMAEAKPAIKQVSTETVPAVNQLVRDLGQTASALSALSNRLDTGGATSLLGPGKLPDYKPSK